MKRSNENLAMFLLCCSVIGTVIINSVLQLHISRVHLKDRQELKEQIVILKKQLDLAIKKEEYE